MRADLTERLGAAIIGATVYEMQAGEKLGPYHYHHGIEEWLYAVSGAPVLRAADGEEGFRFRSRDQIEDYWDGETGAA